MTVLFWGALGIVLVNYVLYPLAAILQARGRGGVRGEEGYEPTVSLVIAAFNEEKVIGGKVENSLALDYPPGKLQVVVASDGSNDSTAAIVRGFADRGVLSVHEAPRRGKSSALNRGVAASTGEIVVFSDANNHFDRDALRRLVRHFADPSVGGVSGAKKILPSGDRMSTAGDGLYWRYESAIKSAESALGSITAADGEITAIRRSLFEPIDPVVINDDAAVTFSIVDAGKRFLYDGEAVSREYASVSLKDDFHVKVRMVAGGFQTLQIYRRSLWPPNTPFRVRFLLHKALRWIVPECMLLVLLSSLVLALSGRPFYAAMVAGQLLFYGAALAGYAFLRRGRTVMPLYVPLYFTVMNAAAFMGLVRFFRGKQGVHWRKAAR